MLQAAIPAAEKAVADLGKKGTADLLKNAGKGSTESLNKATKNLGDLFKKK